MRKNTRILLVILIGVVIVLSTFVTLYVVLRPKDQLVEHEPIIIWNDDDFKNFDFLGDGSQDNPYLIQNYNITTESKYSIYIKNTFKYFVIQNCYLKAKEYSIYLENIADGTAMISNNICDRSDNGIFISNSDDIVIANNTCTNNIGPTGSGIIISDSSYCDIINNYCTDYEFYGIRLEETNTCYLFNNTCSDNSGILRGTGIYVFQSNYNQLVNNTCNSNKRYGIHISVSTYSSLINNTCVENEWIGIYLSSSPHSTIMNNTCLRNRNWYRSDSHGVHLYNSPYSNLTGNIIGSNIGNGIFLESSSDCTITDNLMYNHTGYSNIIDSPSGIFGYAIYCYLSSNTIIFSNSDFNNYGSCLVESSQRVNLSYNYWLSSDNYSIEIYDSSNCSLFYNIVDNNKYGIHLTDSVSNLVTFNLIKYNEFYGVSLFGTSSNNLVHHNVFYSNNPTGTSQGYDEGVDNFWYDNITKEGNLWDDWSGFGNYSIDGLANSQDPYCLSESPLDTLLYFRVKYSEYLRKSTNFFVKKYLKIMHYNFAILFFNLILILLPQSRKENTET